MPGSAHKSSKRRAVDDSAASFICYGRHGEMATNSRERQEATTLSLQLLQNCLMLINTILIQRTIDRQGLWARLQPEDFRALTQLFYGHINPTVCLSSTWRARRSWKRRNCSL
jgi:hypothetical protein